MLAAFLVATFVLAVTPGPGVVYIVTRTIAQGRRAGLASVAGVALGNFGNAVGASLGLAALFAISSTAFTVVKFAGAAYLVYLGIQALAQPRVQGKDSNEPNEPGVQPAPPARILRDGLLVALLNPKTSIFFAAFLPQFMEASASPIFQSIALSAVFVSIAAMTDSAYVMLSGVLAPALRAGKSAALYGRFATAAIYFSLAIYSVVSDSRANKASTH